MDTAQMIRLKSTYTEFVWILGFNFLMWQTIKRVLLGLFIFILASCSIVVASIVGAMEGHTTDIGFLQGGLLGAVGGFITAVQLFGPAQHGDQPLSKMALIRRVVNGKEIMGLVIPFVLKAYQWQIIRLDTSSMEISNLYDLNQQTKGLSKSCIKNIPMFCNSSDYQTNWTCPICLEELKLGEVGRKLEKCGHKFHMICIDEWLLKHETCPICRDHLT